MTRSFVIPLYLLLSCLLFQQCNTHKPREIRPAFYYWKTNFSAGSAEQALLSRTGARTVYLRLFDIDWNESRRQALPKGLLNILSPLDSTLEYIPVVYITQPCLLQLQQPGVAALAADMNRLIGSLCERYHVQPREIQIDCDWTRHSAGIYFNLLRQLKQQPFFRSRQLSCTIRLHQVRYSAGSGIPPVDRGMLMVYNMGNLTRYGPQNSILDPGEAGRYLGNLGLYPLPLDIALPLYHWSVLFERKHFKGILYNMGREDMPATAVTRQEGNLYQVKKDIEAGGYSLKAGQEIRFEQPRPEELAQIAGYISERLRDTSLRLAFFHLDAKSIRPYTAADLNNLIRILR